MSVWSFFGDLASNIIGPLTGGLIGKKSQDSANATNVQMQKDANDTNMAMTQQTNAMNYQIAKENNQFNERMVDKANHFSSAPNQVRLLQEAGINPLMLDSGWSSTSDAATASDVTMQAPQVQAATVNPNFALSNAMGQIASGVTSSINSYYQNKKAEADVRNTDADSEGKRIDNSTRALKNRAELLNMRAQYDNMLEEIRSRKIDNDYTPKMRDSDLASAQKQRDAIDKQIEEMDSQINVNNANANRTTTLTPYEVKEKQSDIAMRYAEIKHLAQTDAQTRQQMRVVHKQFDTLFKKNIYETKQAHIKYVRELIGAFSDRYDANAKYHGYRGSAPEMLANQFKSLVDMYTNARTTQDIEALDIILSDNISLQMGENGYARDRSRSHTNPVR